MTRADRINVLLNNLIKRYFSETSDPKRNLLFEENIQFTLFSNNYTQVNINHYNVRKHNVCDYNDMVMNSLS